MPDVGAVLSLLRRVVVFEFRLYRSLLRWVARRPDVPRAGAEAFSYARTVAPVMWLWIFASAAEVPLIHVLVPWDTVRIVALVIAAWGLVWMIGLLASLTVHPHLLTDSGLRIRYGAGIDIAIPWADIEAITVDRRDLPSSIRTLQPVETPTGTDLRVGVSGQVNVRAQLRQPTTVATPRGDQQVSAVSFFADDPRDVVARARQNASAPCHRSPRPRRSQV